MMKTIPRRLMTLSSIVVLQIAFSHAVATASTIWSGPAITFTKADGADPTLAANQDRLTPEDWITRGGVQGIYNAATESSFAHFLSPADTEWANGTLANYNALSYTDWNSWAKGVNPNPMSTVGIPAVVHLISDDIYLSVDFTSWSGAGGGGFSYVRSTPAAVPEPSSLLLLGAAASVLAFARARRSLCAACGLK